MEELELLIVSKFKYDNNNPFDYKWCYLGWDMQRNILVRPIPAIGPYERDFFWPNINVFNIGEKHVFQVNNQYPDISLPHRKNDVLVTWLREKTGAEYSVMDSGDISNLLSQKASANIMDALGITSQEAFTNGYVTEGRDCQSCGVFQEDGKVYLVELCRPLYGYQEFDPRRCYIINVNTI